MTALTAFAAYGCLVIIGAHYRVYLPTFHYYLGMVIWEAGPYLLLACAAFSWMKARSWRRMDAQRMRSGEAFETLARGGYQVELPADTGPSGLERLCVALIVLGLAALPYWLGATAPGTWAGITIGVWAFLLLLGR